MKAITGPGMTTREAGKLYGVSTSTIRRWIKRGLLRAKKRGWRWYVEAGQPHPIKKPPEPAPEALSVGEWHPQINREWAEKDGLQPEDFTWLRYPCSDLRLEFMGSDVELPARWPFEVVFRCRIPGDTPQLNRYIPEEERQPGIEYESTGVRGWVKIPDPVGVSALSRVKFQLIQEDTHECLADCSATPLEDGSGSVLGWPSERQKLWKVLTPSNEIGVRNSVRVRLKCCGLFFPFMTKRGDGSNHLANLNNGYLSTPWLKTGVHVLSMDVDGNLYLDGQSPPKPKTAPVDPDSIMPDDYQDTSLGAYVRTRREAAGLTREELGRAAGGPWKTHDGASDTDPDIWAELLEGSYIQATEEQAKNLARRLGIEERPFLNLLARGW